MVIKKILSFIRNNGPKKNNKLEEILESFKCFDAGDFEEFYRSLVGYKEQLSNENEIESIEKLTYFSQNFFPPHWLIDEDDDFEGYYESIGNAAHSTLFHIFNPSNPSCHDIEWEIQDRYMKKMTTIKAQANYIDSQEWELIKLYIEDAHTGNDGYSSYKSILNPKIEELHKPDCYAGEFISPTFTIRGNKLNSNCDVIGTQMGATAESMFIFYITDLKQYAVIYEEYPEL